ncbi:MAG: ABC transporter permease [Nanobdellota archaeon]
MARINDYLKLAWENIKHKRLRSWLTLLGIFIGVAAVVSLIGLGEGLKLAVSSQFGVSSTEVITVQAGGMTGQGPPGTGVANPLIEDDAEDIEKISTVDFAVTRIIEQVKFEYDDQLSFGFAADVPDGEERDFVYDSLELEVKEGRFLKDGDGQKINLGYNFGKEENRFGKKIRVGDNIKIENRNFEVVGIYEKLGSFIFDNIIIINSDTLKKLVDKEEKVDVIVAKVKDKEYMDKTKEEIEKLLRKNRDVDEGEEDFSVETPESSLSTVNDVLTGVQIFISLIAAISIIVGAIGIINTMFTSVVERRSQIGIMKALGAKNSDIFFQFTIEAGLMGLIGGIIGSIVGELIAYLGTMGLSSFLGSDISPSVNFILIGLTLFGAFMIGAISGTIPALQAAKQNPVDAIRS